MTGATHPVTDTALAFDSRCELPPINPTEVRLDLIRNDVVIQLGIAVTMLEIAATYAHLGLDDRLKTAMNDARDRMRAALGFTAKLMQEKRDADMNRQAAEEWRTERESRRRA